MSTVQTPRRAVIDDLRLKLSRLEAAGEGRAGALTFALPALDDHLPQGGLAFGAVHEITPAEENDLAAAFGFLIALLGRVPGRAPLLLVLSAKKLARLGRPHGHGLADLGLDPSRLTLVEALDDADALWATEEAARSRGPAAVAATLGGKLDLKASQRLLHATRDAGTLLLILRPDGSTVTTASTRWRIRSAPGAQDRFRMLAGWRWHVTLERCRNGRHGDWMLEFDHATHRFGLAAAMAGTSLAGGASDIRRTG